jgi:cysteine-rich repeat protein
MGDTCGNAIMLPGAGNYSYDSTGLSDDYTNYMGACDSFGVTADGVDMVFAISVGPGAILQVTDTPNAANDAVLVIADDCTSIVNSCVQYADDGISGEAESLTYTNTGTTAQTIFIVADNYDLGATGPFTLDVKLHTPMCGDGIVDAPETCDDMNATANDGCTNCQVDPGYHCSGSPSVCAPIPAGDTCGNAIPITANGMVTGSLDMFNNDYDPGDQGCTGFAEAGNDVAYSVMLGAGQVLNATLSPSSGQDLALYVLTDCASPDTSCVAGADTGGDESVTYTAATDQTVFVIVDGFSTTDTTGMYSLDVNVHTPTCGDGMVEGLEACDDGNMAAGDGCTNCQVDSGYHCSGSPSVCAPIPAGDTCGNAITVAASGSFPGKFDGFNNDYDPGDSGCTGYSETGNDIVYKVTLNAGQMLTATLTPGATQDVAVYVVTDCADVVASCVSGADAGFGGDPEMLTYTATATGAVYVIVDGFDTSETTGAYTLQLSIQ